MPARKFENRWCLITGSATRIGRIIALEMARNGANIIIHYNRSEQKAKKVVELIRELGVEAMMVQADLSIEEQITTLFDTIQERTNKIDILINNASNFYRSPFLDIQADEFDKVIAVNLKAPFLLIQHTAKLFLDQREDGEMCSIVNISDLIGKQARRGFAHHGISKSGVIHLSKIAAKELGPYIRVNTIIPGLTMPPDDLDLAKSKWKQMVESVVLEKQVHPQAIARSVVYLCENEYITGSEILVDSGESLQTIFDK